MRKAILFVLLSVLALSLPVLAGKIQIDPSPISLKGAFHVVVTGVQETKGDVLVVNLRTGEELHVPLEAQKGRLLAGPIYVLRLCDDATGKEHVIHVKIRDVIVAATELGGGLSATASIGKPDGEPTLTLERWNAGHWFPCPLKAPLEPGKIRIVVKDAGKDILCKPESVKVTVQLGGQKKELELRENGVASGQFVSDELGLSIEPHCPTLNVVLLQKGSEFLSAPLSGGPVFKIAYEDRTWLARIPRLQVSLNSDKIMEDVGCPVKVAVAKPADPDEVIWCVDGAERSERGPEIMLARSELTYPKSISVVALVRKGALWGKAEARVVFVPRTEIEFVQAKSGEAIKGLWQSDLALQVKLTYAYDDPTPQVWVGLLGPDCITKKLTMEPKGNGVFMSEPFQPEELSPGSGDILWAEYKDPTCYKDVTYVLLRLQ